MAYPGHETADQIFTIVELLRGLLEFASLVYMCFVALEKAYDRGNLWVVLRDYGVLVAIKS